LAGTGIEPLPFGSNERYALLTGAITTRLYRSLIKILDISNDLKYN
jgi:hypothetical protein